MQTKMDNVLFDNIQALEPALPILSTTVVSCVNWGVHGCVVGFVTSTIDVVAQSYGVYDTPYLSAGVLGCSAIAMFQMPVALNAKLSANLFYSIRNAIGFISGVVIATGKANAYLENLPAPVEGGVYGYSVGGWTGVGIGVAAGLIDESLSLHNVTHKYWITNGMYGSAIATLLTPPALASLKYLPQKATTALMISKEVVGAIASLSHQYIYGPTEHQRWPLFALRDELYALYGEVIDSKQLESFISNLAITTVAAQLSTQRLYSQLLQRRQLMNQQFFIETAGIEQGNVWPNYMSGFVAITFQLLPLWMGIYCADELIKLYTNTKIIYMTTDAVVALLYTDEAALRLGKMDVGNGTSSNTLIKNMYKDIAKINDGAVLVVQGVSLIIRGYYSGAFLINANAADMIIYGFIFNSITSRITQFLSACHHRDTALLDDLVALGDTIVEHLRVNALVLTQERRVSFLHARHTNNTRMWRSPYGYKIIFGTLMTSWSQFKSWINFLYNHMIIFKMLLDKTISAEAPTQILLLSSDVVDLTGWESDHSASLTEIRLAISRLREFIIRLKSIENITDEGDIDYGDGNVVYRKHHISRRTQLCVENFSVGIKSIGSVLTSTDGLCVYGPVVAVTGCSGSGKSTALNIISGIRHGGSWGNGTISFGTKEGLKPAIVNVGQDISTAPFVTLLEDLTCKLDPDSRVYERFVRDIMDELRVDAGSNISLSGSLDKPTDSITLSGGQKKKAAIIRALIKTVASKKTADVVMLDEPFVGLDDDSVIRMQSTIKKYWPDAIILIVDHKAKDNSGLNKLEEFYDERIDFNNVTKTIEMTRLKLEVLSETADNSSPSDICTGMAVDTSECLYLP